MFLSKQNNYTDEVVATVNKSQFNFELKVDGKKKVFACKSRGGGKSMDTTNHISEEEEFQENLIKANEAKEAYWRQYVELVSNLRVEHLHKFSAIVEKDNVTFSKDLCLQNLKENLCGDVLSAMEHSWETCNIGVNIAMLGMIKKKFENNQEENWRPMGKSVQEQTLPIRLVRLEAKRRYLKKQLDYQTEKLTELLKHNQRCRNEIEQVKLQRSFIRDQMQRGCAELDHLKTDYKEMIRQMVYKD